MLDHASYPAVDPWLRTSTSSWYPPVARPAVLQLKVLLVEYACATVQVPPAPTRKR